MAEMKQVAGIWLPEHEEHLVSYIETSPRIDGKGTYQLHKLQLALQFVKHRRLAVGCRWHMSAPGAGSLPRNSTG